MLDPVALPGRVFVLGFDPEASGLPPLEPGPVVVLTPDGTLSLDLRERVGEARVASFAEAAFTLKGSAGSVAIVHTLLGARLPPILAAVRAGVRRFRIVDTPGSSIASNARGALLVALGRTLARARARLLGQPSRGPWPSAAATLRALEAVPRLAPVRLPLLGAPPRVVHWLADLGSRAEPSVALLEQLVPRTRALGAHVELLVAGAPDGSSRARARRLERLGVPCTFLPPREWSPRAESPPLPGVASGLARDLDDHRHAGSFRPLLESLLGSRPTVVHGWLEPGLRSASVVGLAGALVGARVVLHAPGAPPSPGTFEALCLEKLAQASPGLTVLTASPAVPVVPLAADERARRRRLLGLSDGAFLLVATGALEGDEATATLCTAARRLLGPKDDGPGKDALVLHLGEARVEARLRVREAGLGSRLRLMGDVPDAREYLPLADEVLRLDTRDGEPGLERFLETVLALYRT